jgi:hypothetical protein
VGFSMVVTCRHSMARPDGANRKPVPTNVCLFNDAVSISLEYVA